MTALAAYISGLVSAFASTAGIPSAATALTGPFPQEGLLPATGTATAVTIAASVVDVTLMPTNGALLVANQRGMESKRVFRKLPAWSVSVIAPTPLVFVVA